MADVQVRQFRGHSDRLTDACISADSKLVVSAALDGTMRVWDIPSACCMQALHVGSPITALDLSPNMELLATAHVNKRGIYLWSNQLLFGTGGGATSAHSVLVQQTSSSLACTPVLPPAQFAHCACVSSARP